MELLKKHGVALAVGVAVGWFLARNGGVKGSVARVKTAAG